MPNSPAKKRNRLENLKALEVSCVEKGANQRPWVVIKNADGKVPDSGGSFAIPATLTDEQREAFDAYASWRDGRVAKDADGDTAPMDDRQKAVLQAVFRMIQPFADSLSIDDLVAMGAQAGLVGTEDADAEGGEDLLTDVSQAAPERVEQSEGSCMDEKIDKDANWQIPKPESASDADHSKATVAAKAAYAKAMGKTDKAADDDGDEDMEDMDKSADKKDDTVTKSAQLPAEHQAYFAEVQKKHQALISKCAELEGRVSQMRDQEVLKSLETRLETELPQLSMDRKATAQILKSLGEQDKASADAYMATLKAAHEQVAVAKSYGGSLYASTRTQQAHAPQGGSARERFEAMVNGHVAKSGNDKQSAFSEVIKNPEAQRLYEEACIEGGF
jgi:hypothetical protein